MLCEASRAVEAETEQQRGRRGDKDKKTRRSTDKSRTTTRVIGEARPWHDSQQSDAALWSPRRVKLPARSSRIVRHIDGHPARVRAGIVVMVLESTGAKW